MERTILVPVDGSEDALDGLRYALEKYPDADVTALHVVEFARVFPDESREFESWTNAIADRREGADDVLAEATETAAEHDREISTATWIGAPAKAIVEYADEHDFDHVVVGSRGRTDEADVRLGSVAETVLRRAPVLVTVVR